MNKSKTFVVKRLDSGFTISEGGKTKAVETPDSLQEYLVNHFKSLINHGVYAIKKDDVPNMRIEISVEENFTEIVDK